MPDTPLQKRTFYSDRVPASAAPHSHAVRSGGLLFVCGCPPLTASGELARGNFATQMRNCLTNVRSILEDAGSSLDQVLKVNVYLDRISDFSTMNEIYREFFGNDPASWPARTSVQARLPNADFLIEIDCIAEIH